MFNKRLFILLITVFLIACGGEEYVSYTNIVQTTTAQNMLSNATATAVAEVTECVGQQGIVFQTLSDTEKEKWVKECESSFTAAAQAVGKDAAASAAEATRKPIDKAFGQCLWKYSTHPHGHWPV